MPIEQIKKLIKEQSKYFKNIFSQLSPREQKILEMRFGLVDGVSHTLEEVGQEFEVTRERIRQIEAKIFEKVKKSFEMDQEIKKKKNNFVNA